MENTFLPPAEVNYRSVFSTDVCGSAALKFDSLQSINCDFTHFERKIKNQDLFGMLRILPIFYMYYYRGVCK